MAIQTAAPPTLVGLSERDAAERRARGLGNNAKIKTGRSYADIIRQNVFTFINIVLFVIGAILISLGRVTDALLSVGIIMLNVLIGIYQEARAKRKLDQIALLTRPQAVVIRDGKQKTVDPSEIVVGDLLLVGPGDQIVVDGKVVGDGRLEVDESLLTGESDLIVKEAGAELLSGSFCVTGSGMYEATKVGAESFANKLTSSAKAFRIVKTPLQRDVEFAIRLLMLLAVFIGFLLLISAVLYSIPLMRSVQMAAVTAGLVPNGLFFMVIVAYAMGALRIAGSGALIQQTNAVESMSNVNILCMDKTGTLTANKINYRDVLPLTDQLDKERLTALIGDTAASMSTSNKTNDALIAALKGTARPRLDEVAFSSARKWSALSSESPELRGVYVLGALEMLTPYLQPGNMQDKLNTAVKQFSDEGLRVVLFAYSPEPRRLHDATNAPVLPNDLQPLGLLTFTDELRPECEKTLAGFAKAGIKLKVISGDNPHTVAALAKQAGLQGDLKVISGPELDTIDDSRLPQIVEETTVFGRITPQQKERLVDALIKQGAYVAMMGDGVNDVLSLKKANLGIAMQSGSAATRSVADIVLMNDSFAALPPAFLEGQRIISGMRDILSLFLTRALFVALLILATAVVGVGFPYVPTHVSLMTLLTVGIPTLALAAWAQPRPAKRGLLRSVVHFVFPAAFSVFFFGLLLYLLYFILVFTGALHIPIRPADVATFQTYAGLVEQISSSQTYDFEKAGVVARTVLTTFTVFTGLLLVIFAEPPNKFFTGGDDVSSDLKPTVLALFLLLVFIIILIVPVLRNFFELVLLRPEDYAVIAAFTALWALLLRSAWRHNLLERFLNLDVPK